MRADELGESLSLIPLGTLDSESRQRILLRSHATRQALAFPDYLILLLTNRCPLKCQGCATHDWAQGNRHRELSRRDWLTLIRQGRALGADKLMLSGGEPLLRAEDCLALLHEGRRLGMRTALMTSGRGLTRELLGELYQGGLVELSTSLDGPTARIHDAWRGQKGSFDEVAAALEGVRRLRGTPRSLPGDGWGGEWGSHVMSVIAGHNSSGLLGVFARARAFGADLVSFQCLSPDERFPRLKVRKEDLPLLALQIEGLLRWKARGAPLSNSEAFLRQVVPYFEGRMEVPDDRCLAGYSHLILAPDASVSSCRESISREARPRDEEGRLSLEALWTGQTMTRARIAMEGCQERCLLRCWVDG